MSSSADPLLNLFTPTNIRELNNSTSELHDVCGLPRKEIFMTRFPLSDTIQQDKAAVLVYLRMKHKDPNKAYVLCGVVGVFHTFAIFAWH